MMITLSTGKDLKINWIGTTRRFGDKIMIEMADERPLHEICEDFEGVAAITRENEKIPGVKEVFEGFSKVVSASRENADGVVRLTLAKA